MTAITFERHEAARRAGVEAAYIDRLIELGIVTPDEDDRLSVGDVRRAQMAQTMERGGISAADMAGGLRDGIVTLSFMDSPIFERFATFSHESFRQVSDRTGHSLDVLTLLREVTGGATPDPDDRMRDDELKLLPLIEAQLAIGFSPLSLERWLRVAGDSFRRMAETESDAWRRDIMGPVLARGGTAEELGNAWQGPAAEQLDEVTNQALVALWHARQVQTWTGNIIGGFEQALTDAGLFRAPHRPPAICFLDIAGYTRLTDERGDDAAAGLARSLSALVQATAVDHGGRPVKWLGDGVMVYFREPGRGLIASLDMLEGANAAGLPPAHVGLHAGPVLFQEGDYFGQTVNIAARIAEYARPGELLVTRELVDAAGEVPARFVDIGPVELKGLPGPMHLLAAHRP